MQVESEGLNDILTTRLVKIPGNTIKKPLNENEAVSSRDTLSRELYSRLFLWIVLKVNKGLEPTTKTVEQFMGVLDIFGFENFVVNSFEQLWYFYFVFFFFFLILFICNKLVLTTQTKKYFYYFHSFFFFLTFYFFH